jgi:hypothetical protein
MTSIPPIVGHVMELHPERDPVCECGSLTAVTGEGTGPHAASLHCKDCGRFRRWLVKSAAEYLLHMLEH